MLIYMGKDCDMSDHIKICIKDDDSDIYFYNTHTGCVLKLYFNADYFNLPGMRRIHIAKIPSKFIWGLGSVEGISKLSFSFNEYLDWVRFWGKESDIYSTFGWIPKIKFFVKYPEIFEGEFCEVLPSLWATMEKFYGGGKYDDFDLFF